MSHRWPDTPAGRLLHRLEQHYGKPTLKRFSGPFEMILWEIVGYLTNDDRRNDAFTALQKRVGFDPKHILTAPKSLLCEITRIGGSIAAEERADRLRCAAQLVTDQFDGDLNSLLKFAPQKAKKLLMQFPMIGEPGAEKILLLSGVYPVLALESNGVRVLIRMGIGKQNKGYAATYKSIREATLEQLPADCQFLSTAHLILRQHGRELCLRTDPTCGSCPARTDCSYFQGR